MRSEEGMSGEGTRGEGIRSGSNGGGRKLIVRSGEITVGYRSGNIWQEQDMEEQYAVHDNG